MSGATPVSALSLLTFDPETKVAGCNVSPLIPLTAT